MTPNCFGFHKFSAKAEMEYLWAILLLIVNAGGLVLTVFMLPGNWLMVTATVLLAWYRADDEMFSIWTLAAVVTLAIIGELLEFLASALGVKGSGGSRWSSVFAIVGGICGAVVCTFVIPIPILGTLIGVCGGAFVGASLSEASAGNGHRHSARIGFAAGAGSFLGIISKLVIGIIIWLVVAVAAFWP